MPHEKPANAFEASYPNQRNCKAQHQAEKQKKASQFENFTTLEQACSPEYQGAQGAFKNSMIH